MTYGDGVADVDINASIAFHQKSGTFGHPYRRVLLEGVLA